MDKGLRAHHFTAMRDSIFTPFSIVISNYGGVEKSCTLKYERIIIAHHYYAMIKFSLQVTVF